MTIIDIISADGTLSFKINLPEGFTINVQREEPVSQLSGQITRLPSPDREVSPDPMPRLRSQNDRGDSTWAWNPAATMVQPRPVPCPHEEGLYPCPELGAHTHYADGSVWHPDATEEFPRQKS